VTAAHDRADHSRSAELPTVLTTAQAYARFGRGHVRQQLATKRWQRPVRGIVVRHNGPLDRVDDDLVALLSCAPGAALAGVSALRYDGLTGFEADSIDIVSPEGARRLDRPGVTHHWSTMLSDTDVHPLRAPRRTRPQRSVVDAASWSPWSAERRARALVLACVQQGLARPRDLRDALSRRGPCRHRALIVESILDARGGIQSIPELDFELIRRRHGLPEPLRQSIRRRRDGKCYLDAEWPDYDTACEIHGIPHIRVAQWESDLARANEIVIAGPRLLVFSSYAVRRQQPRVGDQLVRMLRRGGWPG
jgi:hypothetical protein